VLGGELLEAAAGAVERGDLSAGIPAHDCVDAAADGGVGLAGGAGEQLG
jgi:hypothetical protein